MIVPHGFGNLLKLKQLFLWHLWLYREWDLSFGLLHVQYGKPAELERAVHFPNQTKIKPDVLKLKVGFHFVSYNSDTAEHDT